MPEHLFHTAENRWYLWQYQVKHLLLAVLFCLFLPIVAHAATLEAYSPDHEPAFSLPDLTDQTRSLSDYRGKVVLVNFWATWCPPCVQEMPKLVALQQRLADRAFVILAINVGEKKYRVRKFTRLIDFDLPVLLDTSKDLFTAWGLETLPTSFIVDAEGRVRYRAYGDPGWDDEAVVSVLEQLLTDSPPQPADRPAATDHEADR